MRAATYRRVSTGGQRDNTSLPEQQRLCAEEAARRGWTVVAEYADEGVSGKLEDRPDWQGMLRDARDGKFDALIVLNTKRFSRNSGHAIVQANNLLEFGVSLVSLKENFDYSTPAGRAMYGVMAVFAELDRETIVENTVQGQRAKARAGRWPGGQPPYGWRLEGERQTAHPVPDEAERAVIQHVHRLYVKEGLTSYEVAQRLATEGLLARGGGNWHHDRVRATFRNPVLWTGVRVWGSPDGRKKGRHTRVDAKGRPLYGDPIESRLPDPPLTQQQFDDIQRVMDRTRRKTPSAPVVHPLGGRLFGVCGKSYRGVTLQGRADTYRCTGNRHEGIGHERCGCLQVSAEDVEPVVWQAVVDLLSNPDRLRVMAEQWLQVSLTGEETGADEDAIARVEATVERLERARVRATKAVLLADDPTPMEQALAEVQSELTSAQNRLDTLRQFRANATDRARRLTDLALLATRAAERLPHMTPAQRAEVLALLDVRVTMGEIRRVRISTSVGSAYKNEPERLAITGTLDPRLFGDGGADGAVPKPADPDGSGTGAEDSLVRAPGTVRTEHDGGGGVRRPAGPRAPQRRGARHADRPGPPRAQPVRRGRDGGAVTVELAIGMVSMVVLLGLVLALVAAGIAQIRCTDAARAGARAAALGDDDEAVALVVRKSAGGGASTTVARADGWVDVTVRVPVLGGVLLDGLTADATAGLPVEP